MPLLERPGHKADHDSATSTAAPAPAAGSLSPRVKQLDVDKVVRYVAGFTRGSRIQELETADARRSYIASAIQAAHRDQGVVISDAEALELVAGIAARDSAIERALDPPVSLDPNVSKSTTSPTRKGGARGRM